MRNTAASKTGEVFAGCFGSGAFDNCLYYTDYCSLTSCLNNRNVNSGRDLALSATDLESHTEFTSVINWEWVCTYIG